MERQPMKFGNGVFNLQVRHGAGKPHTRVYREMLEQVELAEELGFDSAWLIEHHFKEDGECPSVPPSCDTGSCDLSTELRPLRYESGWSRGSRASDRRFRFGWNAWCSSRYR